MKNEEYIERYIYAVTKAMPRKLREDVSKELQGLIADMLDARCDGLPPEERDVRVVLAELGRPGDLAEQYAFPGGQSYLIGPGYYRSYRTLLTLLLPCICFGLSIAFVVLTVLGAHEQPLYAAALQWLGMLLSSCFCVFGAMTILFAIFERKGIKFDVGDEDLDNLPPVPNANERISRGESAASILLTLLFCIVFLLAPNIIGWDFGDGLWTPLFQSNLLQGRRIYILLFALLGLATECFKLADGRYTRRVAIATIIADLCSIPLAFAIFSGQSMMNPDFIKGMSALAGDAPVVAQLFLNFQMFFIGIILFALVLEMGTTLYKAMKAEREMRGE